MKRFHIALAVNNLNSSIIEYSKKLGENPICIAKGQYVLWRTDTLNFSISVNPEETGKLRPLGFEMGWEAEEDPSAIATDLAPETDGNGFIWEQFTAAQQRREILRHYPDLDYSQIKPKS